MQKTQLSTTVEKSLIQYAAKQYQPINGSLELLPLCNMNCDMCYVRLSRAEMERQGRLRTADEWIRLAGEMEKAGVLFLLLTGGEPLLFPDFRRLYLELKNKGIILTINTNGTLIDEEWAEFFGKNKPRRINITLYGADDTAYQTLCHYPGGYSRAIRGIELLREKNVDVKIASSVTKQNLSDLERIQEIGRKLGAPVNTDTYMLPCVRERERSFDLQCRLSPEEAALARVKALRAELSPEDFQGYVKETIDQIEHPVRYEAEDVSCLAGRCSFTINWQGEMRPCVTLSQPSVPVFETGFEAAWKSVVEGMGEFRLNPKCKDCSLRPICNTCVSSAFWETGSYDGVPEYNCKCAEAFLHLLYQV